MATRIVVMGAHPGTIRTVIDNPLPYPRDEHHPEFLRLSQWLHGIITQAVMPDEPAPVPGAPAEPTRVPAIPNVSLVTTVGLLEVLENEGDLDLHTLAQRADVEFTQILPVVNAAEVLGWVKTPGQRVIMTDEGRKFLAADVNHRKQLLNAKLRQILVFDLIIKMLANAEDHEMHEDIILGELAMLYPHERPTRTIRTVVAWGRYAELFKYSGTRKVFYLDSGSQKTA